MYMYVFSGNTRPELMGLSLLAGNPGEIINTPARFAIASRIRVLLYYLPSPLRSLASHLLTSFRQEGHQNLFLRTDF
jgi:hypothetical protein